MAKLTDEQKKEYVARGGVKCPECRSEDIEGGPIEVDAGGAWQEVSCHECGAEWKDVYTLTGVEQD